MYHNKQSQWLVISPSFGCFSRRWGTVASRWSRIWGRDDPQVPRSSCRRRWAWKPLLSMNLVMVGNTSWLSSWKAGLPRRGRFTSRGESLCCRLFLLGPLVAQLMSPWLGSVLAISCAPAGRWSIVERISLDSCSENHWWKLVMFSIREISFIYQQTKTTDRQLAVIKQLQNPSARWKRVYAHYVPLYSLVLSGLSIHTSKRCLHAD